MKKSELKKKIEETRTLLNENPEVMEHLSPLHQKIAQALLREKREYTAAGGKAGKKPAPSP